MPSYLYSDPIRRVALRGFLHLRQVPVDLVQSMPRGLPPGSSWPKRQLAEEHAAGVLILGAAGRNISYVRLIAASSFAWPRLGNTPSIFSEPTLHSQNS